MKKNIHPTYHSNIVITCVCGAEFLAGSTAKELKVEICGKCHPFYTGKQKLIDSAGRVDKFEAKRKKAEETADNLAKKKKQKKQKKSIVEYVDLEETFQKENEKKKNPKKEEASEE